MPYTQTTVVVNSATVPVSLVPVGNKVSWIIRNRTASAVAILMFFYAGTLPGAAPAAVFELPPGQSLSDADYSMAYTTDAMGSGIAAVLASGVASVTVDTIIKS